jgi:hypothetical protein
MEQLQSVFPAEVQSSVMVMDQELALTSAIQQVFPKTQRLLYIWHIKKNVLVHTLKEFEKADDQEAFMKAWVKVVSSNTEEDYEKNWLALKNIFGDSAPGLVLYVRSTRFNFWKRLIVKAFMDKYFHFGNRVTSQVERVHSTLKSYLPVSTGNLKVVHDKITLMLTNQHSEYNEAIAHNCIRTPHTMNNLFYS